MTISGVHRVAGRKKENFGRSRVEFKADPDWIKRAYNTLKLLGFGNLSDFIRYTVTKYMDQIDTERGFSNKQTGNHEPPV